VASEVDLRSREMMQTSQQAVRNGAAQQRDVLNKTEEAAQAGRRASRETQGSSAGAGDHRTA